MAINVYGTLYSARARAKLALEALSETERGYNTALYIYQTGDEDFEINGNIRESRFDLLAGTMLSIEPCEQVTITNGCTPYQKHNQEGDICFTNYGEVYEILHYDGDWYIQNPLAKPVFGYKVDKFVREWQAKGYTVVERTAIFARMRPTTNVTV